VRRISQIKDGDEITGSRVRVKVVKNLGLARVAAEPLEGADLKDELWDDEGEEA